MKYITFAVIWIVGCLLADFVLQIEQNAWAMSWGFMVGTIALHAYEFVLIKCHG